MSRASEWISLAAAPTLAAMAFLSAAYSPAGMLCGVGPQAPVTGMTAMYVLMAVFHVSPWLRRLERLGDD